MSEQPVIFTVGGAVQAKAGGTYLHRPADEELFKVCRETDFAYVLASRQIGKSSLMYETASRLRQAGVSTAIVDLNSIGQTGEAGQWYLSLIDELATSLQLKTNVHAWWETKLHLTVIRRFLQFLRDVVLQEITTPVVIFIDEIDMTLGLDFTDDFFAAVRTLYNERIQYPVYKRLTFVLLGAATPDELIQDENRTPFNVGQGIALRDFSPAECALFQQAIQTKYPERDYFEQVYAWVNGHPFLIQKLSKAILEWPGEADPDLVEILVNRLFLEPEERGDDNNLHFVQSRIITDRRAREMLRLYKQILEDEGAIEDDKKSIALNRLKLYGLVEVKGGRLQVRNKLYRRFFDLNWVEEMLHKNTQQLGIPLRYRIVQEIDRGGFSTIYLAEMTSDGDKIENVALKVLDPREENAADSAKLIKRFEREAKIMARLKHPNIIPVYETDRSETGRGGEPALFIAMKYIPGGTLARKIKIEGPLRRDEAMTIVQQIGSALAYAHEQGVIHRDVKPTNILLDHDYNPPHPVLTDFGLVKELATNDESFTTKPAGTVRYMAPEQLAPERWKQFSTSPATDIYALAITFFEMLTGLHPFEADSDHKLSDPEFISKHLDGPFPRLGKVAPQVGMLFDDILAKATAKDPTERFATVTEFVEALEVANDAVNRERAARLVRAAGDFERDQNPDEALAMIEKALQIYPDEVEALRLRAKINRDRGHLREALADYQQAYQRENNPASPVGLDYLDILQRVAKDAWHEGAELDAMTYYGLLTQILNEGRTQGSDVQAWAEAWAALVKTHYTVGFETAQRSRPDNLAEVSDVLDREIRALEGLKADRESQDLREKLRQLRVEAHYAGGEQAYAEGQPKQVVAAIYTLKREIRALAALAAEVESDDLRKKQQQLRIKCHYTLGEKAFAAGQIETMAATIKTLRRKMNILIHLEAKSEYRDLREKLKQCHQRVGEQAYAGGQPANLDEAMAILVHEIGELKALRAGAERQDLIEKYHFLQIKSHHQSGLAMYAGGNPDDLEQAMTVLEREIAALETLQALTEIEDLSGKLKDLQIKQQKNIIEAAVADISRLKTQMPSAEEKIFHHYDEIDKAYAALLEIDPKNVLWHQQRREQLKARATYRQELGSRAEQEHNYEIALQHYQAILNIEEIKQYDSLARELNLNLLKKIDELKQKVDHDRKYRKIEQLLTKNHLQALDRLIEDFISKGVYEHREVAKLLWWLVYAKQNKGQPPPELQSAAELEVARHDLAKTQQQLAQTEQGRTQAQAETAAVQATLSETEQTLEAARAEINTTQDRLAETEQELAQVRAEIKTLQQQLTEAREAPQKLKTQHEINKITIPIFLIVAVIAGGIVGPQFKEIPGIGVIAIIALILVLAYFGYYVWVYYISPPYRD